MLTRALYDDERQHLPCVADPHSYTSEAPKSLRAKAALLCRTACPQMEWCRGELVAARNAHTARSLLGTVWAGEII